MCVSAASHEPKVRIARVGRTCSASSTCLIRSSCVAFANVSRLRSRYVLAACERAPSAIALHCQYSPDGLVSYRHGPLASVPTTSRPRPYGLKSPRVVHS